MESEKSRWPGRSAPGASGRHRRRVVPPSSSVTASWVGGPVVSLEAGDRVTHSKFGLGTVVSTSGIGDKADAMIDFGSAGTKRLLLRYAPVEKL